MLTGCSSQPTATETPTSEVATAVACSPVSEGMRTAIAWGLDQKQAGLTIDDAASIPSPYDDGTWLVAAIIIGPGVDPTPAVWLSQVDPATAPDTAALVSVDSVAAEFSDYAQPNGTDASMDGYDDVVSCLTA
jgi:hypothetical protein